MPSQHTCIPYIDLHADTITALNVPKENLHSNRDRMVSLDSLKQGGTLVQCFSAFVPTGYYPRPFRNTIAWKRFIKIALRKNFLLNKHRSSLTPIRSANDVSHALPGKRVGLLFTIEDLGLIGNDLGHITTAEMLGVRIASLIWNHENTLAYPNSPNNRKMQRGLKPLGFAAVEELNRLHIVPDVSHLSDGGFWDVIQTSSAPVIATHSNARAITNHPRNLTDEMIKAIADKGGVIGLNFCPYFLSKDRKNSRIEDMVRHVLHIRNVGGSGVLAIGSDFDGISGHLEIGTPARMPLLFDALSSAGLSSQELDDLARNNVLRVLRDTGI